ncbi:tryptophan--tRNA ligase [Beggiatoa leptomitoformis]|uniref:Tryptophan--tRNA ligase n=1 Tax=Beggiatoa leptomitoformis TaxID=288004 RepID=A0A2N9YJN3_9GAMM|nr:tryptophan--tRNA ligase [Beggiatoa leptomitoformis]ALG67662.2 tryptophan--tRNA ligase [Beggiatoa leptomitoformis]AUI70674.2 tryptophan--tRNA ligase [Beggiatoa leptomitoformis]
MSLATSQRVLSGMRPTGQLHLGHYHGVLKNWIKLQYEYRCFFFAADWHALTTQYDDVSLIAPSVWDMLIDWLSVGINPSEATLFIQSKVPEHAELHLLLSMSTPLSWLERVPTYKDQQQKLKDKDLATYGFLGYPLLQSADILIYKAGLVPVGEDQVAHVEITRELARRFNFLYGREPDFQEKAKEATRKMGKKNANLYNELRKRYQEQGDGEALSTAQVLVNAQQNISLGDKKRLLGFLEGETRTILPEPEALLTETSKMPGLDGQKMSKSYGNTITLRETPVNVEQKVRTMPTDPARVRRTDAGEPEKCPVWQLHKVYSPDDVKAWVQEGCRSATIGCIECKQPVIEGIIKELAPIQEKCKRYQESPETVRAIMTEGCEKARAVARETLEEVRQVMGLSYR